MIEERNTVYAKVLKQCRHCYQAKNKEDNKTEYRCGVCDEGKGRNRGKPIPLCPLCFMQFHRENVYGRYVYEGEGDLEHVGLGLNEEGLVKEGYEGVGEAGGMGGLCQGMRGDILYILYIYYILYILYYIPQTLYIYI